MARVNRVLFSACLSLALTCAGVFASTNINETVITSSRMTYDYGRDIAEFDGDVKAVDSQVEIRCDKLRVFFRERDDIKAVSALGNVTIYGQLRTAYCEKAIYFIARGEIVLMGNARVIEDGSELKAGRITFWVNENKLIAERARLSIVSKKEQETGENIDGSGLETTNTVVKTQESVLLPEGGVKTNDR